MTAGDMIKAQALSSMGWSKIHIADDFITFEITASETEISSQRWYDYYHGKLFDTFHPRGKIHILPWRSPWTYAVRMEFIVYL
jgi:hypothetical protein